MQANTERIKGLRELLNHERTLALDRVREYRAAQEQEALSTPGDELDFARALADVETHASLIERAEDRLSAIDTAFDLVERGRYGICAGCGEEIPLERLKVLPFATLCVECQQERNEARRRGEGTIDEPFAHVWNVPEEMAESTEASRDEFVSVPGEGVAEELPAMRPPSPKAEQRNARPRRTARTRAKKGDNEAHRMKVSQLMTTEVKTCRGVIP